MKEGVSAATAAALAAALICGWTDLRSWRVPNVITLPAFVLALALRAFEGGTGALLDGLLGVGVALAFGLAGWLVGGVGGGDVKLGAALGAALGPGGTLWVLFWASALAVVWGLARVWREKGALAAIEPLLAVGRGVIVAVATRHAGSLRVWDRPPERGEEMPAGAVPFAACLAAAMVGRAMLDALV